MRSYLDGQRTPAQPPRQVGICVNVSARTEHTSDLAELSGLVAGFADSDFTHIELGANGLGVVIDGVAHPARLRALREALSACAQRLTLHGSWTGSGRVGNLLDPRSRPAQVKGLLADLEIAAAIGAEVVVYHAGTLAGAFEDDAALAAGLAGERDALRRLGDRAAQSGIVIAVENRAPTPRVIARRSYGMRLDLVAGQVQAVGHPHVTLCLDTGHAFLAAKYLGFDFLDAVRDVAPLVGHVHLADNFGRIGPPDADLREMEFLGEGDLHLPPGWGSIPLRQVLAIPYPRDPVVILEIRHLHHHAEALAGYRALLASSAAADR
jgi:sugar phosphate isomerase/epimerase